MDVSNAPNEDLKSRIGYLTEYQTAKVIADRLVSSGVTVANFADLEFQVTQYLSEKIDGVFTGATMVREKKRAHNASYGLGEAIYTDVARAVNHDFFLVEVDIIPCGGVLKNRSKSDLIVNVRRADCLIERMEISLKSYRSANINLANNTYLSWVRTMLFTSEECHKIKKVDDIHDLYLRKYGVDNFEHLSSLKAHQDVIIDHIRSGGSKRDGRVLSKLKHPEVIDIIGHLFMCAYAKNKDEINRLSLSKLGLYTGAEHLYVAVSKRSSVDVFSSRTSEQLRNMLEVLSRGFDIEYVKSSAQSAKLVYSNSDGIIFESVLSFADTGGKHAIGKINNWVNIVNLIDKGT